MEGSKPPRSNVCGGSFESVDAACEALRSFLGGGQCQTRAGAASFEAQRGVTSERARERRAGERDASGAVARAPGVSRACAAIVRRGVGCGPRHREPKPSRVMGNAHRLRISGI